MRTCTDCGETQPLDDRNFLPIRGRRNGFYGRCRVCRNRRARERYWSSAEITAAERARALRNFRRRRAAAADA